MDELLRLQAEILDATASMLEPDGLIVYSTCSMEPEENHAQTEDVVARRPGFTLKSEKESIPFESGCDGAYAAALQYGA